MNKGKRGVALNRPCPVCGSEVPALYKSPVQQGLCGKCTDEALKKKAAGMPPASARIVSAVPGGGHMVVGFAIGLAAGVFTCLAVALFASGFWESIVSGLGGMLGR